MHVKFRGLLFILRNPFIRSTSLAFNIGYQPQVDALHHSRGIYQLST